MLRAAPLAALLLSTAPPASALRQLLAQRWGVAEERIHIVADAATLAAAGAAGRLRVVSVLADGRVLLAGTDFHGWIRAGVVVDQAVAARDLARGETIDSAAVRVEPRVAWGGAARHAPDPLGWICLRAVPAGTPLLPPAVAAPPAVRAGENVRVSWRRGAVTIELAARAGGTGVVGDTIAVRTAGGHRVRGVIRAPGELQLLGGEDAY